MKRSAQQACCSLVLLAIAIVGMDLVPAAAKYGFEIEVRVRTTCRQAPQGDEAPDSKLYGDPSGAKEKLHCFQRNEDFLSKYPVLAESEPGGSPFALHVDHHHELGGGGSRCAVETNYDLHRSIPRGPIMEVVTAPVENRHDHLKI